MAQHSVVVLTKSLRARCTRLLAAVKLMPSSSAIDCIERPSISAQRSSCATSPGNVLSSGCMQAITMARSSSDVPRGRSTASSSSAAATNVRARAR
jgi:hypothetical protein